MAYIVDQNIISGAPPYGGAGIANSLYTYGIVFTASSNYSFDTIKIPLAISSIESGKTISLEIQSVSSNKPSNIAINTFTIDSSLVTSIDYFNSPNIITFTGSLTSLSYGVQYAIVLKAPSMIEGFGFILWSAGDSPTVDKYTFSTIDNGVTWVSSTLSLEFIGNGSSTNNKHGILMMI